MKKPLIIKKTKEFVQEALYKDNSGHDYWHVLRVYELSKKLAEKEEADTFIVELAALLHDIGEHGPAAFHTKSCAEKAKTYLSEFDIPYRTLKHIESCILTHSWSKEVGKPASLEAQIVSDADALDAVGAIGVIRTAQFASSYGIPIHDPTIKPQKKFEGRSETMVNHFYEKLFRINENLYIDSAKKIADKRVGFMKKFLDRLLQAWPKTD